MSGHFRKRTHALRTLVLGSVSLAALTAAPSHAQTVSPMYGQIRAFYGDINPAYGKLSPFYGKLRAFYGKLSPFYGDVSGFYGNISPFVPSTDPTTTSFYGRNYDAWWGGGNGNPYAHAPAPGLNYAQVSGFWTTEEANWLTVQNAWTNAQTSADFANVASMLKNLVLNPTYSFWGKQMNGAAGKADLATVLNVFTQAGIVLNKDGSVDPTSLQNLAPSDQAMFFLNYYDAVMNFTGTGHVDWWMGPTGWSPALAGVAASVSGSQAPAVIGMLDFTVNPTTGKDPKGSVVTYGSNVFADGHGAAVGSLIVGSASSGIMGILPTGAANIVVYDPYDSTATTNWTDVGKGIDTLATSYLKVGPNSNPVGVINASLGESGWTVSPGWNTALASGLAHGLDLVIAAGNDGVTQTTDVAWTFAKNPTLIIVGSVGVDGTISNFSNTPGEACLVDTATNVCTEANKLKYHFLVAPGELILVGDGNGGFSRQTGTSLAAPLVTGAIGLLQTRWPWLANYPNETAQIIFQSATPLGTRLTNPSVPDSTYGWGELNIAASQQPLNWNNVTYYTFTGPAGPGPLGGLLGGVKNALGNLTPTPLSKVIATVKTGTQSSFNSQGLYFTALETVGNTYRDFQIPMSSTLVGQNVTTGGGQQLFQSYLSLSLRNWVAGGANFANADSADAPVDRSMLGFMNSSTPVARLGGMDLRMRLTPSDPVYGFRTNNLPMDTEFALVGKTSTLRFGYGDGASALGGSSGFSERSDYSADRGGANPLLGLASGGAYAAIKLSATPALAFDLGVTTRRSVRDINLFGAAEQVTPGAVYEASAEHFGVDYTPSQRLALHASVTRLHEDAGLLGIQSYQAGALNNGSTTTGFTVAGDYALTRTLMFSASGTVAGTRTEGAQALTTGTGGLVSTAAEVALTKSAVFTPNDRLRLTLSKPMSVNGGRINFANFGVVDRQTGELGLIQETVNAAADRTPVAAELLYGRLLPKSSAEISVFMRASDNTNQFAPGTAEYMAGAKYRFTF